VREPALPSELGCPWTPRDNALYSAVGVSAIANIGLAFGKSAMKRFSHLVPFVAFLVGGILWNGSTAAWVRGAGVILMIPFTLFYIAMMCRFFYETVRDAGWRRIGKWSAVFVEVVVVSVMGRKWFGRGFVEGMLAGAMIAGLWIVYEALKQSLVARPPAPGTRGSGASGVASPDRLSHSQGRAKLD
jgi:hypothetical protein